MKGCQAMGIEASYLNNNRKECLGCGWCNYGCRYNRKTSMLVTYIPWAEAKGTVVFDQCLDAKITLKGNRATGVKFSRNNHEVHLTADKVVVSAGAIGSSALLLQSGIFLDGLVGQKFHVLGGAFVTAQTEEIVNGFDGIGLTCVAKASSNYVIESYFAPPLVFSISTGGFFLSHYNRMLNYTHFADAGVMVGTEPRGQISLDKKKNPIIDITFSPQELEYLKEGIKKLSMIYFNGGAVKVLPSTFKIVEFSNEADLKILDKEVINNNDLNLGTAHPQGGNVMNEDKKNGVVGCDFKVHGYENLYVADTSIFPTNIRTNCQATAMAVSHYAADFVAEA
jgi:choline dehydrogenase-like flavoprotein